GGGPIGYASSAMSTCSASRSASENTATEAIPCSRQARITRTAISPRFATRTLLIFIVASRGPCGLPRGDLEAREEVGNLERRRVGRVGAVHGVRLDGGCEILADRAGRGLGRIGGAHEVAPFPDRVVTGEDHGQARPLGHERAQAVVERALPVDDV